ncbi:unnamed protein product [Linum tenue]|uniref:DNA repair protein UVH3 n=1 Tax=Linum tenue TaxID=586396 RepID=A0AAV0NAM6_9ROSI|nr:unnamed protein product [Linum tenue]
MGVQGLWDLLAPVGRRVSVETLSGKRLAIDASIWLVQFMKAMRDEKGDMVRNAHLLGFFRRICKLLYLRTKPVFVFDGGTPALKRRTVIARRRQRENAQAKIRKTAEKLLLNQLKTVRLKELAKDLENQRKNQNNDSKGKKVSSEPAASSLENRDATFDHANQEKLDEMLAASIAAEENVGVENASTFAGPERQDDEDEDLILPEIDGDLDPDVLAALPSSIRRKVLMKKGSMVEGKQFHDETQIENSKKNEKGKEVLSDPAEVEENNFERLDKGMEGFNQEKLDEMLAASLLAEEDGSHKYASTSAASAPFEGGDDDDEEMILPTVPGKFDPAVLAALPPSMQLDLLVQMRERLMAENRQRYQKVKKAPEKFSELQIQAYLKTVAFRREIDQVQKAAAGVNVGGVQTSRIASEANREFIFSSSFTGDKQLFTSGGVLSSGDKQQPPTSGHPSHSVMGGASASNPTTMAGIGLEESGHVFDDDVETYTDERGRIRLSRGRAMGMRMTRDLQRNLDIMKEMEQVEIDIASIPSKTKGGKANSGGGIPSARTEVRGSDDNSVGSTQLNERNEHHLIDNNSCMQISFEIDGASKSYERDDDMFSCLVAGQPIDICSVDNDTSRKQALDSASDSDWEEGTITTKWDGSSTAELVNKTVLKASNNSDDSEVEWEEEPSVVKNKLSCQVPSGKPVSRGKLQEDADLQEAIRRSLKDPRSDQGFAEIGDELEVINRRGSMQELNMVRKDIQESNINIGTMEANEPCGPSTANASHEGSRSTKSGMHGLDDISKTGLELTGSKFEECRWDTSKELKVNGEAPWPNPEQSVDAITEAGGLSISTTSLCPAEDSHIFKPVIGDSMMSVGMDNVQTEASMFVREDKVAPETEASFYSVKETIANSSGSYIQSLRGDSTAPDDIEEQMVGEKIPGTLFASKNSENHAAADTNHEKVFSQATVEEEINILGQEFMNLEGEQRKHERNAESVTSEMFAECQELLQMFGIPYIIAPMEAEAQCAYMELAGLVDGVVTDDSDVFLFGACSVYKNIFDDRKYVETYFLKDIEKELGLTRDKLIRIALLLGSDYTEGVSGIGIVNAIEVVDAFPEEDGLQKFREWIESPDPTILGKLDGKPRSSGKKQGSKVADSKLDPSDKDTAPMDGIDEIKQIFMDKHRNVSKNWYIPSSFPSEAVISAYWSPQVDKSTEPFTWGKPDLHLLQRLCWERFGWNVQKSQELLLPVLKEYNKRETQLRLEAFYTFNERFAKIRSKRIKKAVKGITGKPSSTVLDDVPEEAPELTKKRRATPAESELKSVEGSILSSDHNLSGNSTTKRSKKVRSTGKDISSEKEESGQELLSGNRQQTTKGSNKGGRGRGSVGRKGKGIGSGRGRGRGRGRRSRGLEPSKQSSGDTESSSDEHEDQIQNSETPTEVRRSKRLRQPVSYASDLEMDDMINSVDPDGKEEAAGEAKAHPRNADSSPALREPQNLEDDLLAQMDTTPREYLETGGGFCMDEGEAGNPEDGVSVNPSESNSSKDYLESGGGFCVNESDAHKDQPDVGSLSPPLEGDTTEKPRHGGLMDEVDFAAFSSLDAVNESAVVKDPCTETLRTTQTDDHLRSGSSSAPENTVDDTMAPEAGGLRAMPFLKRKRRKS